MGACSWCHATLTSYPQAKLENLYTDVFLVLWSKVLTGGAPTAVIGVEIKNVFGVLV